jgi:lipopolysaccharide export system protein LptA
MSARPLLALLLALGVLETSLARAQLPAAGPIELEADSSEIDHKNSRLVFHNVRIRQGDMSIRAELAQGSNLEFAQADWVFTGGVQIQSAGTKLDAAEATLNFLNHRIHRANLEGTPVAFEQTRAQATEPTRGHAGRIEYDFDKQVLRLTGNAWLSEGQNEITGDTITYEIGNQRVIAGADEHGERVRITIVPPPDTSAPDSQQATPPPDQKP